MKSKSIYQFTRIALPFSFIIILCGLTLSKWPLFVYDSSLKPSFQILSLFEVLRPALFGFIVTVIIEISIRNLSIHRKSPEKYVRKDFSTGTVHLISILCLIGLWTIFVVTIAYYIYHWHNIFVFYYLHQLLGDIILIMGLFGYIALLSFFIIKYNSQSTLEESTVKS